MIASKCAFFLSWATAAFVLSGQAQTNEPKSATPQIGSPGGLPSRLPHHLTCGSASGGSGQINGARVELGVHLAVMQIDPLLSQVGHSPCLQPAIVQRSLHNFRPGHKPVTSMAAR